MKNLLFILIFLLLTNKIYGKNPFNKRGKTMDMNQFVSLMEKTNPDLIFKIQITGEKEFKGELSKNTYFYYELTAHHLKNNNNEVCHEILWYTKKSICFYFEQNKISVRYQSIRPYLKTNFIKTIKKDEITEEKINIKLDKSADKLEIRETGLLKGKIYYAKIAYENYYLPPNRPDGEPKKRKKAVLIISDTEFDKNNKPINPKSTLFSNWSY